MIHSLGQLGHLIHLIESGHIINCFSEIVARGIFLVYIRGVNYLALTLLLNH